MARVALRDLLDSPGVDRVGLADLKLEAVEEISNRLGDDRIQPMRTDANDAQSLVPAIKGWDAVINSTWYELNLKVMGAAIAAGTHYLDLGGLYHMTLKQLAMHEKARDAGITCVLGLGSSPGVTNLMAAVGAARLSTISSVEIRVGGAALKPAGGSFNPPYSFRTIIDEACLPAATLRGGEMEMVPGLSVKEEFVLPDPVGKVEGYFTLHSELATLPQNLGKGVKEMNFIVAFSPEFSRAVRLLVSLGLASRDPIEVGGRKVVPYEVLTRLVDMLPPPGETAVDYGVRRVRISGEKDGRPAWLIYDCVSGPHQKWGIGGRALGTGVPASLGAQWLASGRMKETGAFPPETCINPKKFLQELNTNQRGIVTYEDDGSGRRPL